MHGVAKICDFQLKSPFNSETVRDRSMVTIHTYIYLTTKGRLASNIWNVNRKLQAADRYVLVPMTLSDPNSGFKVTV